MTARQSRAMQLVINRMARWDLTLSRYEQRPRVEYAGRWANGDMPANAFVGLATVERLVEACWLAEIENTGTYTKWILTDEGRCAADPTDVHRENQTRRRSA